MNPGKHALLSVRRWGGQQNDYLNIHRFIDHTKSLCPDMRHRILHTTWAVNNIIIPIFGDTITNADGKSVDTKDMCERDHLLADYQNKFIPTLSDFVDAMDEAPIKDFKRKLERFHQDHISDARVSELMLSPLSHTGRLKSLLITHNSWFVNEILPKVFSCHPVIDDFLITPAHLFNAMSTELWMDNGIDFPQSAKKMEQRLTK